MGCVVSLRKSTARDDLTLSVCRDRKQLIKSAVDRRYALAGAHCKYNQSLYAVALALRLFVSRHSASSSSKYLITFPEPSPKPTVDLHHTQPKPTNTVKTDDTDSDSDGPVCEHFYDDDDNNNTVDPAPPVTMTSANGGQNNNNNDSFTGWDFFNPFDNFTVNGGYEVSPADGGRKVKVSAPPENKGRELLEALKDVEDYFLKAYECGVEFSKMLEFNHVGPLDHLDSKVESSEKYIPAITWHKSPITRSPSCRSLLSSSSRSSFSGININGDLFDDAGGMESGSHLSTLGRLYAWEKKLYDEVKAGNEMKKMYERKSSQLSLEKASNKQGIEDQVNDLYSRILVNMKICDSISKRIEKVRDNELLPQIVELLRGLTKTWKSMLESHKTQSRIMFEVKSFTCADPTNDKSRHLATLQLEAEIQNWCMCFSSYIASMEAYVEALTHWAYKTTAAEREVNAPPLIFNICREWSTVIKSLPDQAVTFAMKRFAKDLRTLWAQQEIENQQNRKVDKLVADSAKRAIGFEREERNVVNYKSMNVKSKVDVLADKKARLDVFTDMVETEKAKHKNYVEETHRIVLVGFQTGFSSVFDSLTEFSEVCLRKYNDVAQNATLGPHRVFGS
ncbi:protein ALTERED PHOSPHATE STARVATION RESPONSE 1-like isoform X1 [Bidens hawaiensis]|uniref:protein ALTERED PHOSPHATE STARVATION RESPONSE 1-like isoform X1 n=1 Tax=Bidens hawaiensis TaxID=980011 RepID=UPI00404B5CD0